MAKISIESFEKNSHSDYHATLIVNTPGEPYNAKFGKKVEVIEDDAHYLDHPPTRWFVEPKSDVCLFIDHDVFVMRSVLPLLKICRKEDAVCGVIAYRCRIETDVLEAIWLACGVDYKETDMTWLEDNSIPCYYNYGVLAVPTKWLLKIREYLPRNVEIVNQMSKGDFYLSKHGGQVALAVTLAQLDIPTHNLSLRYNYPNDFEELEEMYPEERKNVVFWHCLDKYEMDELKEKFLPYSLKFV